MDNKILKQLKNNYEDLEIKPSANLWDQIEDELDKGSKTVQKSSFQWWKYAAVIAFLISVGSLFYFNSNKFSDILKTIATEKSSGNIRKPIEVIESVTDLKNEEVNNESEMIVKSEKLEKKYSEKLVQTKSDVLNEISIITNTNPQISIKPEINNKPEQIISESPQLATTQPAVKETKVKYITANDLIFQRKYSIEKKDDAHENVKRLGIIKINRINISPEFITIFNSSNSTSE
ncbi:hypothetical protein [Chryseobacterium luquanense]|uniref:Anti-sigma factor n=1 Tax=Chryseobacterium luquanense TaxID=2983766 RepID=A0ABT3Y2P1_9FLAO|nr:hypothetical protein [Chryseobacterium luquanense]MCX8532326.1 hypothetical protein [Chryseobacterium luquanense]